MAVFLTADTHFGHKGICRFTEENGKPVRPWDDVDEMNEAMVQYWNETVSTEDKVYVLGDYVINRKFIEVAKRLNGKKCLIKGNHDIFRLREYTPYFYDVRSYHVMNGLILSHIPIHPMELDRFGCNVHGHLHTKRVLKEDGTIDPRYYCVSVEHTNFRPISIEKVIENIKSQGGSVDYKKFGN